LNINGLFGEDAMTLTVRHLQPVSLSRCLYINANSRYFHTIFYVWWIFWRSGKAWFSNY